MSYKCIFVRAVVSILLSVKINTCIHKLFPHFLALRAALIGSIIQGPAKLARPMSSDKTKEFVE